jgi:pimeloyl-ACP methyl ester carboxylesterase
MILAALLSLIAIDTPYTAQNVQYYNQDSSIHFAATLTIPKNKQKAPALILVSGTGRQDRDGTMGGHKMFFVIADYLSRNGYAVLRVDDRGTGETTGKYEDATTEDFAKDVLSSISYLKTRKEIGKIGLIGHSEGGAAAYMAAAQSNDVSCMISLAGLATEGITALKQQNMAIVGSAPIVQQTKDRYNAVNNILFDTVYRYAGAPDLETHIRTAYAAWKMLDDEKMKKEGSLEPGKGHFFFPLESYIHQATGAWYRYHIRFDPAPWLQKVKVPVLAINGDKDIMVDAVQNLGNYQRYTPHVQVITVKGLNHLFQHAPTEDFAPEVLVQIKDWLNKQLPN